MSACRKAPARASGRRSRGLRVFKMGQEQPFEVPGKFLKSTLLSLLFFL